MNDIFQERYLDHQAKKKEQLMKSFGVPKVELPKEYQEMTSTLLKHRRSQRIFTSDPINPEHLDAILESATYAPNSCNRHGIQLRVVADRTEKNLLNGILVGGVGWCYRADIIVLFIANPDAYKSPNEKDFMHYTDVGFTAMNMWLTAESFNIGACYINPNIMPTNKPIFTERFGKGIFCGALALGHYYTRVTKPDTPSTDEIML